MEILVCIKQVPDDSVEIHLKSDGTPNLDGVTKVANAFDTYALEMATRLKEAVGGEITVVSIGEDSVRDALKNCLAVGAEHAYQITDAAFDGSDSMAKAELLAKAKAKLEKDNGKPFDLIFCGFEATDRASGQTGAQLAAVLNAPLITSLVDISSKDGKIVAKQETDFGYNSIEAATPCVVTVSKPEYDPRYPTIKNKLKAKKMPIGAFAAADLGVDASKVGQGAALTHTVSFSEPAQKEGGVKINEKDQEEGARKLVAMMVEAKAL
ncbi:MAG TPA: electron transfer flavoprotein subunit beta [Ruminococcaceae bacterium]|nr:electron transfer flavoprotein subunit beta [Oscillospiraceae bacterium]